MTAKRKKPETVPVKVEPAHWNAVVDESRIDGLAESYLTGTPAPPMSRDAMNAATARIKVIEQPAGCPEDHEQWRQEVARLLGIAIYKMALRLAREGDQMPLSCQPVAMAVATDKMLLLRGQATSFDCRVTAHITHEDLLKRIKGPPPNH